MSACSSKEYSPAVSKKLEEFAGLATSPESLKNAVSRSFYKKLCKLRDNVLKYIKKEDHAKSCDAEKKYRAALHEIVAEYEKFAELASYPELLKNTVRPTRYEELCKLRDKILKHIKKGNFVKSHDAERKYRAALHEIAMAYELL